METGSENDCDRECDSNCDCCSECDFDSFIEWYDNFMNYGI